MADDWEGLDTDFVGRLQRLNQVCPFSLTSGRRTRAEQERLYNAWRAGQHNVPAVAEPGTSRHESGQAADIHGDFDCFATHAPSLGLHFPVKGEPWHVEPAGARGPDGGTEATTGPPADPVAAAEAAFMKVATGAVEDPMSDLTIEPETPTPSEGSPVGVEQIAQVAFDAGFRGDALVTAIAVALAESSGNPQANAAGTEDSRGLWQINVDPSEEWGRERAEKYGDLYNPATNATAAWDISAGGANWNPWTMYRNGTYRQYVDIAKAAAAQFLTEDTRVTRS